MLDRPLEDDDGSSFAKVAASVFSDALATLVIIAFVPMEGDCQYCLNFLASSLSLSSTSSSTAAAMLPITVVFVTFVPFHSDAMPAPVIQLTVRDLVKSR